MVLKTTASVGELHSPHPEHPASSAPLVSHPNTTWHPHSYDKEQYFLYERLPPGWADWKQLVAT